MASTKKAHMGDGGAGKSKLSKRTQKFNQQAASGILSGRAGRLPKTKQQGDDEVRGRAAQKAKKSGIGKMRGSTY